MTGAQKLQWPGVIAVIKKEKIKENNKNNKNNPRNVWRSALISVALVHHLGPNCVLAQQTPDGVLHAAQNEFRGAPTAFAAGPKNESRAFFVEALFVVHRRQKTCVVKWFLGIRPSTHRIFWPPVDHKR